MPEINPAGAMMLQAAKKQIADSKLVFVDVPEWLDADGKPSRIWYRTTMTLAEIFDTTNYKLGIGDERHRHAYAIIRRALDANGNQLFTSVDEETIVGLDGHVIMRLSGQLTTRVKVDDAKKD